MLEQDLERPGLGVGPTPTMIALSNSLACLDMKTAKEFLFSISKEGYTYFSSKNMVI